MWSVFIKFRYFNSVTRTRIFLINLAISIGGLVIVDITIAGSLVQPKVSSTYRHSEYYGDSFRREAESVPSEMVAREDGSGEVYFQNVDKTGRWINVVGGNRVTVPSNALAAHTVYAFGGSTTLSGDVPDSMTWPSQLARRLPSRRYRVVNLGVNGASLMSRVERLRAMEGNIKTGDVLVFYFGVNEALFHREFNVPRGLLKRIPGLWGLSARASSFSNIARLVVRAGQRVAIEPTVPEPVGLFRTYIHLFEARAIAERRGASVLFVLQPNYFIGDRPPTWQANLETSIEGHLVVAIRSYYKKVLTQSPPGLQIVDATEIFDSLAESPYFDWMHVNEFGNSAIGEFVARRLVD